MIPEQGSPLPNSNIGPDAVELASYFALKRLIGMRSLLFVSVIAVFFGSRSPNLGLDFELGGLLGIANMYLVMRANERLLDGRVGRSKRAAESIVRLLILGTVPVLTTLWGPWWSMGVTLAGIFIPLALYTLELHRRYRTGKI